MAPKGAGTPIGAPAPFGRLLEDRVDEGREHRPLCEHQKESNRQHDQHDWHEPPFLALTHEQPEFRKHAMFRYLMSLLELRQQVAAANGAGDPRGARLCVHDCACTSGLRPKRRITTPTGARTTK